MIKTFPQAEGTVASSMQSFFSATTRHAKLPKQLDVSLALKTCTAPQLLDVNLNYTPQKVGKVVGSQPQRHSIQVNFERWFNGKLQASHHWHSQEIVHRCAKWSFAFAKRASQESSCEQKWRLQSAKHDTSPRSDVDVISGHDSRWTMHIVKLP